MTKFLVVQTNFIIRLNTLDILSLFLSIVDSQSSHLPFHTAFGRGVNVPDIRFGFHTTSVTTSRRLHGRQIKFGIKLRDNSRPTLEGKELDRAVSELDAVVRYTTSGDLECR